ncbi:MAG: beta-ketoacyl synthase N-terminal-like domain-containing protein [Syntrophobacteraceae bacterium]|nr:beta-ketoacyl synthase N-terminal-like domain-containing protein [Syntrophobacteraceae bacterium]
MKTAGLPLFPVASDQVAITGLGAVCSLGNSLPEIVSSFLAGKSGAAEITGFDASGFGCLAAPVKNLAPFKTDISSQLALTMGKHLALLMSSVGEALRSASIGQGMFAPGDCAFFAGMGMVDYHVEDLLPAVVKSLHPDAGIDYDSFFLRGSQEIYPLWPLGMLNNVAFCQASIHFGLAGENAVFCPHADSGVRAVYEAACALREGRAKMALAGGIGEEITPLGLARAKLKNLLVPPPGNVAPPPFLGEAGAMLVLEPLSTAVERGAHIYARISGFGFSCERSEDGRFASTQAISSAMRAALSDAGISPEDIDLVMLATSHENELEAVLNLFDTGALPPVIVAASAAVGETLAAGPALSCALALSMPDRARLPEIFLAPSRKGASRDFTIGRLLLNGISCEGGCGAMIFEGANGP